MCGLEYLHIFIWVFLLAIIGVHVNLEYNDFLISAPKDGRKEPRLTDLERKVIAALTIRRVDPNHAHSRVVPQNDIRKLS